jgi:pyrroloquinoline quinone (PQQ) biosynthesis protein C
MLGFGDNSEVLEYFPKGNHFVLWKRTAESLGVKK